MGAQEKSGLMNFYGESARSAALLGFTSHTAVTLRAASGLPMMNKVHLNEVTERGAYHKVALPIVVPTKSRPVSACVRNPVSRHVR